MAIIVPLASAQTINVTVDGDVILFVGQPPVEQRGMVLVPLRGVFEKLGATVAYDGASRTIRAVKGTTEVTLRLGSTEAFVNGQRQTLALPAQTQQGTTLVPLRFVSEALGAQVSWRGVSRTVVIQTSGSASPVPLPTASPVEVSSLTHDAQRPLRGGERLAVTLLGTPGSTGTFSVSGIESARELPLREQSVGTYTGVFTVPLGVQVKNAPLFASLRKGGLASPLIQAAQPVTVDGIGPQLANLSPASDTTAAPSKLLIYATLADTGTGIDTSALHLLVNGKDVTGQATVTEAFFSYRPDTALPAGKTSVAVVARDLAGNETRREWSFQLSATAPTAPVPNPAAPLLKPTILTPAANTAVGDKVTITGKAAPDALVRYRLTFQGTFLILPTDGVVTDGEVRADKKGLWSIPEIRLQTPLGVSKLTYTLEATTVGVSDALSETASITFKK